MSWANIKTKAKTLIEARGFTESTEKFNFDYVPDQTVDKAFFISAGPFRDPRESNDVNTLEHRQLRITIHIAYKVGIGKAVTVYDSIPTDWENISSDFEDNDNRPTGVIIADLVNADMKQMSEKAPYYIVSEIQFDFLYRL